MKKAYLFASTMNHPLPKLIITKTPLIESVRSYFDPESIIITDSYNYASLKEIGLTILVTSCTHEKIQEIKSNYHYSKVIAVGGCTALDAGKASAGNTGVVCFPTILSTTCISVDRSKIQFPAEARLIKTKAPIETIICMPVLLETPYLELVKWTQSGFGDLFANISASIDLQFRENRLSVMEVKENVPESFQALQWVNEEFDSYNEECLQVLANYLHNSSLEVIKRDNTELSSGGEHTLYDNMVQLRKHILGRVPTHGQIVAVGTLINAKILEEYTNQHEMFSTMKKAYKKLQLPVTFSELASIGIDRFFLEEAACNISKKSMLGYFFAEKGFEILDRTFEK